MIVTWSKIGFQDGIHHGIDVSRFYKAHNIGYLECEDLIRYALKYRGYPETMNPGYPDRIGTLYTQDHPQGRLQALVQGIGKPSGILKRRPSNICISFPGKIWLEMKILKPVDVDALAETLISVFELDREQVREALKD